MSLRFGTGRLALLGCFVLASFVGGQQAKKDDAAQEDNQVSTTKAAKRVPATSVNFRKDLNLPFDSLSTLGSRIESARRKPDPVALAHTANELAVAEKVSGKTASITSQQLIKESAELASVRRQEAELKAVLQVSNQLQTAEGNLSLIKDNIALAQAQAKQEKDWFDSKEEPTSAPRKVVLNNYTTQYLDLYVNGNYMVQVAPGSTKVVTIEHRWNPTILTANGNEDEVNWGPKYIWGKFTKYTWNIE
jgi:hypothetical protein